jgi:hypothetical protein
VRPEVAVTEILQQNSGFTVPLRQTCSVYGWGYFMRLFVSSGIFVLALSALSLFQAHAADDELTIAPKPGTPMAQAQSTIQATSEARKADHVWLEKSLKPDAYLADAAELARVLGKEDASYAPEAIIKAIKTDTERAGAAFSQCLNPKNCPDPVVRLGAVRGISIANPKDETAGKALAACVIAEKNEAARKAAADLIKTRKDKVADKTLVQFYVSSFDEHGVLLDADHERAAIDALKMAGHRALYEVLMAFVTMDVRAGTATELTPPQTVYMTNGGNVNAPNGNINLPIDLPNLELKSINTTIIVPAFGALKRIAGENFHNIGQAQAWVNKQE